MFHVLGCVFEQHDLRLVVLAAIVCFFACFTAMGLIMRARDTVRARLVWVLGAGTVAGAGIWSTHFVAMLAYQGGLPIGYSIGRTLLSIVIAVSISTLGFAVVLRGQRAWLGGAIIGCAIALMHFVGMSALSMPAYIQWDASYVIPSIALGIAISMVALHFAASAHSLREQLIAATIFTVAICALHFTAMAAVTLVPFYAGPASDAILAPTSLAVAVATTTLLIIGIGFAGAIVDRHLEGRAEREAERLRAHILELEATKQKLEQISANLSTALEAADAGNKAKSQFLAAMSHELRTPLNAIIGFSEMMQRQTFGPLGHPNYRQYIDDIRNSGAGLLTLINDVLDFTHLDGGGLVLNPDDFDLGEVIQHVLATVEQQAKNGEIAIISHVSTAPLPLHADRRRVTQALLNIVSNAVKFTGPGGTVTLDAVAAGNLMTITVADTGIGMTANDLRIALERFGQVDGSLSRKYEGAGLGLPLAKQLIELHGGTLAVESALDHGTTVRLNLPLAGSGRNRRAA